MREGGRQNREGLGARLGGLECRANCAMLSKSPPLCAVLSRAFLRCCCYGDAFGVVNSAGGIGLALPGKLGGGPGFGALNG